MSPLTKECLFCGKTIVKSATVSRKYWHTTKKFCSVRCSNNHNALNITDKVRQIHAETARRNIAKETNESRNRRIRKAILARKKNGVWTNGRLGKFGEQNPGWLGEKAAANSKHKWIQRHWEKTGFCEECGDRPVSRGRNKFATHWSSNDHKYRRIREEWQELCPSCHLKKDILLNNSKKLYEDTETTR